MAVFIFHFRYKLWPDLSPPHEGEISRISCISRTHWYIVIFTWYAEHVLYTRGIKACANWQGDWSCRCFLCTAREDSLHS